MGLASEGAQCGMEVGVGTYGWGKVPVLGSPRYIRGNYQACHLPSHVRPLTRPVEPGRRRHAHSLFPPPLMAALQATPPPAVIHVRGKKRGHAGRMNNDNTVGTKKMRNILHGEMRREKLGLAASGSERVTPKLPWKPRSSRPKVRVRRIFGSSFIMFVRPVLSLLDPFMAEGHRDVPKGKAIYLQLQVSLKCSL